MTAFQTFHGRDVSEALSAVRAAFGADALIGSTRHLPAGRGGAFDRALVEVTAAPAPPLSMAEQLAASRARAAFSDEAILPRRAPKTPTAPAAAPPAQDLAISQELRLVRSLLEELNAARKPRDRVISMLNAAGIEGSLASELANGAPRPSKANTASLHAFIRERMAQQIRVLPDLLEQRGPRVIACIGPTGVGKTTTLAKLAAKAHLELNRRVAVVTLDTYRVGAVEQMRRFAELIGVSFDVAHGRNDLSNVLAGRNLDLVFVDTPSRAPSDAKTMSQLMKTLEPLSERAALDILLTLPASIRAREVERYAGVWETCPPTGLVVTKFDETDQVGGLLHAACRGPNPTPFAYVCNGPRVPEDLHVASVDTLVDAMLPR
jgi:flagellar biosynthesis protein FlhF